MHRFARRSTKSFVPCGRVFLESPWRCTHSAKRWTIPKSSTPKIRMSTSSFAFWMMYIAYFYPNLWSMISRTIALISAIVISAVLTSSISRSLAHCIPIALLWWRNIIFPTSGDWSPPMVCSLFRRFCNRFVGSHWETARTCLYYLFCWRGESQLP